MRTKAAAVRSEPWVGGKANLASLPEHYLAYISAPHMLKAEKCRRSFSYFVQEMWETIISEPLIWNWHMEILCQELQKVAERVFRRQPKLYDLVINVPPGTTKSTIATIMFPAWCWIRDDTLKFITGSYALDLTVEHSDTSRDLIRSAKFQLYFPHIMLRQDKDAKSNFHNTRRGSRYSTSVGGTVTGMHGHLIIIDDPLNPKKAASDVELRSANIWMERTLSTRKINKEITPTILIMQRLHERDPSGILLEKAAEGKKSIRHLCLPGEVFNGADNVYPPELAGRYVDGMLDPLRMGRGVLLELEADLGQYGYAGQIQQRPAPPEGGMFKTDRVEIIDLPPSGDIKDVVRYWDKAGTDKKENPGSAHTAGVKVSRLSNGKFCVMDVVRGQWATDERENIIKQTAQLDGPNVKVWVEQEPGSGGKDSARGTVKNLVGYSIHAEPVTGDKVTRADPFSVQVNWGHVVLLRGRWNRDFLDEMASFPFGRWKDQVDAAAGAFNKIALPAKRAGVW